MYTINIYTCKYKEIGWLKTSIMPNIGDNNNVKIIPFSNDFTK